MKRRILMVSAMILLLGSQADVFAQKRFEPDQKRPGMEMRDYRKPCRPMDRKTISQGEILRLQDFYWRKYKMKISKKEAERILLADARDRHDFKHRQPFGPGRPQGTPRR